MDLNECQKFARHFPLCSFATAAGSQPHVRTLLLWTVTGDAFWFHTGASTHLAQEIKKNPKVEICFSAPPAPPLPARMMRVTGFCEHVDDKRMKTRLLEERPSLISLGFKGPEDPELVILRVHSGEIRFFAMETFLVEKDSVPIEF
jgi:general stress protein 26